ncbi:MAG: hypothetical protein IJY30_00145 [Muribaculaceae bacterium]|nr:hypothetical protein [Muribaculaceae bacterium]
MMRYFILTLLFLLSLTLGAVENLIVRQASGDTSFAISQISHVVFSADGSGVILYFTDGTNQTFGKTDFLSLRFNTNFTGAELVGKDAESAIVYNNDCATLYLLGAETPIYVYSPNGSLVAETDDTSLCISHLPAGAYVVKSGSLISKILKR